MKAVIVDGIVTNGPHLRAYWQGVNDRKARIRRGMFIDRRLIYTEKPYSEPEPSARLWRRLRADVNHLSNKVMEMRAEKKEEDVGW
ncbi:hypothetical protein LCGC14_1452480 [marine sediment metagenome]|uniref:Uncharacterized protein n=1 Tax=marine sediment metagenome TaxID=412755 RepID=A0A0F9K3V3_9ZZZZ|nr:hypothetical protein [Pricia sp.]